MSYGKLKGCEKSICLCLQLENDNKFTIIKINIEIDWNLNLIHLKKILIKSMEIYKLSTNICQSKCDYVNAIKINKEILNDNPNL